jgi:uncharacterized RDD family membrane protein YckC
MKCPKCGVISFDYLERCRKCGADWIKVPSRPIILLKDRVSATEEDLGSKEVEPSPILLELQLDEEIDLLYERFKEQEKADGIQWGGWIRRSYAFFVDLLILELLFLLLSYLAYVGYSEGLLAHRATLTPENWIILWRLLMLSWLVFGAGYFVVFHGMGGQTVGKWLFGLKVVGPNQSPVTLWQAFLRFLGYFSSAVFGLGFFWIILDREKRGWHDLLARTWVIRTSG